MENIINNNDHEVQFDNIISRIKIPENIKKATEFNAEKILAQPFTKDSMYDSINAIQMSIKVDPLIYVDETKFYTCIDAAYKVYEQLVMSKEPKFSKTYAWLLANIALFTWFFKHNILGKPFTGREVEKIVDLALRAPNYFMLKYSLLAIIQAFFLIAPIGFSIFHYSENLMVTLPGQIIVSFYLLSSIINMIKLVFKIRKGQADNLDPIKPSV